MARLFLAHSSADKRFVSELAETLTRFGHTVWYDQWEIRVGDSIVQKINDGISSSEFLVVILSPDSVESAWVTRELNGGFMKELEEKKVIVLPALYRNCQIPPLLREKRYADFTESFERGIRDLSEAIPPAIRESVKRDRGLQLISTDELDNIAATAVLLYSPAGGDGKVKYFSLDLNFDDFELESFHGGISFESARGQLEFRVFFDHTGQVTKTGTGVVDRRPSASIHGALPTGQTCSTERLAQALGFVGQGLLSR